MEEKIIILDFGSQYTQLIARRIRELNIYCEIHPFSHFPDPDPSVKGYILSGSPCSVRDENSPRTSLHVMDVDVPVLGICYGAQLIAHINKGDVEASRHREYGRAILHVKKQDPLLENITASSQVWMSHGDTITRQPEGFTILAGTDAVDVAAYRIDGRNIYGIQFHPEVTHTAEGKTILKNFCVNICGCVQDWTPAHFIETTIQQIREQTGDEKVILGLSGGVDSSVAAALIHKAIGENLVSIFIDNGLLRKDEFESVLEAYHRMGLNVKGVDASDRFLNELEGIADPELKRKTIGRVFIEVFEDESKKVDGAKWLAQGTIYPDVIESVSVNGPSVTIKSHHNVGGLPERMHLKLLEPLRSLFKDEVRRIGKEAGVPDEIIQRHPFPGPGLSIRALGEITREKLHILKEADAIFIDSLKKWDLYDQVWQALAVFLPIQSVGVMGDERTYENVICLRAVTSVDGMTADWAELPTGFLAEVSNKIINRIKGVNRVVYDISSKPPSTIEWE